MLDPEPGPHGDIAQLGERVLCKHEVVGSIPSVSTILLGFLELCKRLQPEGACRDGYLENAFAAAVISEDRQVRLVRSCAKTSVTS